MAADDSRRFGLWSGRRSGVNGESEDDIFLYDLRNESNQFVTLLKTPGDAKAVSIFNGLGYVADGVAGLQVVNYLPYDADERPPTGKLVLSATNTITVGNFIVASAEVQDDVQVRNVEFSLDGQPVVTDGNFPFEFVYRVPTNQVAAVLTFSARVADTGGNAITVTNVVSLTVVPDDQPPIVRLEAPLPNQRLTAGDEVIARVTAVDNVGIAAVELLLDGQPVRTRRIRVLTTCCSTDRRPEATQSRQWRSITPASPRHRNWSSLRSGARRTAANPAYSTSGRRKRPRRSVASIRSSTSGLEKNRRPSRGNIAWRIDSSRHPKRQ